MLSEKRISDNKSLFKFRLNKSSKSQLSSRAICNRRFSLWVLSNSEIVGCFFTSFLERFWNLVLIQFQTVWSWLCLNQAVLCLVWFRCLLIVKAALMLMLTLVLHRMWYDEQLIYCFWFCEDFRKHHEAWDLSFLTRKSKVIDHSFYWIFK